MDALVGKSAMNRWFPLPRSNPQCVAKDQSFASVAWHLLAFPQESRAMTKKMYKESWVPVDGWWQRQKFRWDQRKQKKRIEYVSRWVLQSHLGYHSKQMSLCIIYAQLIRGLESIGNMLAQNFTKTSLGLRSYVLCTFWLFRMLISQADRTHKKNFKHGC